MRVRIDEAWNDSLAAEVHFLRRARREPADFVIAAYGEKTPVRNRYCLRARTTIIDRDYVRVEQNQLGRGAFDERRWRKRKGAEPADELTP